MTIPLTLRALDPAHDADAVVALMLACDDYTRMWRGTSAEPSDGPAFFDAAPPGREPASVRKLGAFAPASNGGEALVAIADIVPGHPVRGTWFIGLLLVRPEWRFMGIGARLVARIEALAIDEGGERLALLVVAGNERALGFWRTVGFRVVGRREAIAIGERMHERVELEKAITARPTVARTVRRRPRRS